MASCDSVCYYSWSCSKWKRLLSRHHGGPNDSRPGHQDVLHNLCVYHPECYNVICFRYSAECIVCLGSRWAWKEKLSADPWFDINLQKRLPYPYFQWLPNGLVISFEIRVFGSPRSHFKNLDLSPWRICVEYNFLRVLIANLFAVCTVRASFAQALLGNIARCCKMRMKGAISAVLQGRWVRCRLPRCITNKHSTSSCVHDDDKNKQAACPCWWWAKGVGEDPRGSSRIPETSSSLIFAHCYTDLIFEIQ